MRKTITFLLTISLLAFSTIVNAIPAKPGKIDFKQPDGQILTITLQGDEFIHWAETIDNYTVLQNEKGYYAYAIQDRNGLLVISNQIAHNPNERRSDEIHFLKSAPPKLRFDKSQVQEAMEKWGGQKGLEKRGGFPTIGSHNLVMILANFNNTSTTYTQTDFDNYMNQEGFNGTGSFKDYYLEVSYGQLVMTTVVTAWVTVPNSHDYYGPDTKWGEFARDAVEAADAIVDYSQFDNDGDGDVDGVAIIHQGAGQEASGSTNDIWSHSWNLSSAGYTIVNDGVTVDSYTTQPEIASGGGMSTIGVMCHEFGHNLGAPDYYDTNYGDDGYSMTGTGQWDIMAGGSWNNGGANPAQHNAYTKWKYYEWIAPTELTYGQQVSMANSAENDNGFYYYTTPTTNEYWLLENRQQIGFDSYVPGHGLLIYHVDESYINSHDNANDINAGEHQGLYPVCATATGNPTSTYGTINSSGTPFPGTGPKTEFTDATTPASISWASANTNKPVTNISEGSNIITFDFMGGGSNPSNFVASAVSPSQINLSWDASAFEGAVIAFSIDGTFGTPVNGTNYIAGNTIPGGGVVLYNGAGSSYSHTGLQSSTLYHYKIWAKEDVTPTYTTGTTTLESTLCDAITSFPYINDFVGNALPSCWENIDNDGSGQVWEFNNPGARTFASTTTGNGFAILDSDNYGSGNSQDADMVSPTFDFTNYTSITLSFEHYFRSYSSSSAAISYSLDGGSTWTQLDLWTADEGTETNPALFSQDLTTQLEGESNVKFKWNYTGSWGYYWCVDDIEVDAALNGTPYTVTFTVTDGGDSHPIDAASVSINSTVLTTDISGEATIDLIDGSYPYIVSKTGYDNGTGTVVVSGGIVTENVSLSETMYTLTFVVEDENSQAVENASVSVNSATLTTDVNGEATIDLVNGSYSYTVSKTGYDNATGTATISGSAVTENVTLTVPKYTVSFTVSDAGDSHALDGASILINSATLTADFNGLATIDLADGTYAYTVTRTGYDEATGSVTVSGEAVSENVSMTETIYTLAFVVEDENSQTVENASISINSAILTTDVNGEATIDLPDGTYSYTITKAGYSDATGSVTISGAGITENVTLFLPTYVLTFNVTGAGDAHVIEGASISINSTTLTTNVDGIATIDLVDGDYPYMVSYTGYDNVTGTISVSGGAVTENVVIYKSSNVLTFVVQDESSNAIDGATVSINSTTLTTDANGEATITLPNADFAYTVTKTGFADGNGSATMAGVDATKNVTLYSVANTVTFNVTDGTNPLVGASIDINSTVLLTDGSGVATINLPDGTYSYTITYTGYDETAGSLTVSGADVTENATMTESAYTVTFTVQNEGSAAVEGATISINSTTLTTDASGQTAIDLLNGSYSYTVTKAGLADANGSVTVASAAIAENVTMYSSAHTITFTITDANGGNAIEGAAIAINSSTLLTDASGDATINLPDGNYAYSVSKDGYESASGNVTLSGADATENISLNSVVAITFEFNVTDIFCYGSSDGEIEFINVTGGSGIGYEYSINGGASWQTNPIVTGLAAGAFNTLVKDAAGNLSATQSVTITQSEQMTGFIVDTENVTIYGGSDGSIAITGVTGGSGSYEYSIDGGTTYENSNLFENLLAANYDIVVKDSYGCEVVVGTVTITEPPMEEYAVTFEVSLDNHVYEGATIDINSTTLTTDADGLAAIDLPDGSYNYTASVNGFDDVTGTVVVAGAAVNETISFVGLGELSASQINIYPNPVSSALTIDMDGSFTVTLVNGIGNVIVKKNMDAKGVLEVDQYADGLYLLRIEQNGKIITKPVIIKK